MNYILPMIKQSQFNLIKNKIIAKGLKIILFPAMMLQ